MELFLKGIVHFFRIQLR